MFAQIQSLDFLIPGHAQTHRGFDRVQKMTERTRVKAMTETDPMTCVDNSLNRPPKNKPFPVATLVILSSAKSHTQIVPNTPFAR